MKRLMLFGIICIGFIVRIYGVNWDQGWHLHPDERFLAMVTHDISLPQSIQQYFDGSHSQLNPANHAHSFFVYGLFPLTINKLFSLILPTGNFETLTIQGRLLSVLADMGVLLLLYFLIQDVEKKIKIHKEIKYFAVFLYAVAVLPIQQSHFYTVDTFSSLFCWAAIFFLIRWKIYSKWYYFFCSGLCFGFALGSKIASVFFFPPIIGIIIVSFITQRKNNNANTISKSLFLFVFIVYISMRFVSPYYFESASFFDLRPSVVFTKSLLELKSFERTDIFFPPSLQWINIHPLFVLQQILFFGLGVPYALFCLFGIMIFHRIYRSNKKIWIFSLWLLLYIVYYSFSFAKTIRYLYPLYPVFAVYAAYGLSQYGRYLYSLLHKSRYTYILIFLSFFTICVWPIAFLSIYTKDHSRVVASKWIAQYVKNKSIILTEYWDDPLPLSIPEVQKKELSIQEVHIFDPDTKEKWDTIYKQLREADYYITSSNRAWGTIPNNPEKYPITSSFYQKLKNGSLGYKLVQVFHSYPSLRYLGIPLDFPDYHAEEAFTVYDHPQIHIYQKKK